MSETPTSLDLDPGAPPRKASSGWRSMFWIGFLLGTLGVGWILYNIGSFVFMLVSYHRFPHKMLYQNSTLLESQPSAVVRPLIDAQQTFDIAVSVWVRATEEEEEEHKRKDLDAGLPGKGGNVIAATPIDMESGDFRWTSVSDEEIMRDDDRLETPLFSDIAFRGLRLSDKGISTAINFRLPTARFLGVNLTSQDLRASFVLIPSSPSLMDHLKNYSSYIPAKVPPRRAWPFPLGSPQRGNRTLVDEALESFGISAPLIEFREIQSRCSNSSGEKDSNDNKVLSNHDDNDDEEEESEIANQDTHAKGSQRDKSVTPVYKVHPHVITRTQLRIVDETSLFNRKAYNKAHKSLKTNYCGQFDFPVLRNGRFCTRTYRSNGHWETRLQLEMPMPGNRRPEVQWAYAPYLDTYMNAAGPLDLVAVPVSRENCSNSTTGALSSEVVGVPNVQDKEFLDITWHISFSGRSPGKLAFTDMLSRPYRVNHNASEWNKTLEHDAAELHNALHGHRFHDGAHPKRRLLVIVLRFAFTTLLRILNLHYWYTCVSTVFISISGTTFLALSITLRTLPEILVSRTFPLGDIIDFLVGFMMIKAITRATFGWKDTTWIPVVRRAAATHKERASMRLDARTSWHTKGGLFLSLVGIYYFLTPHRRFAIPSAVPNPTFDDLQNNKMHNLNEVFIAPLELTGIVIQLLLNHRSRTFNGQYKMSAVINLILQFMALVNFLPAVLGRIYARPGFSAHQVVYLASSGAIAWQALTLPSVLQTTEDENEE